MPAGHPHPTVSVMTLNLRFGRADDGDNRWDNRRERYRAFFREYRPDLIGMQEANDFQVAFLQEVLEDYHCVGQRVPAPPYWQDNVIFFHKDWQCVRSGRFFFSNVPEIPSRFPESKWPRQCIHGTFRRGSVSLLHLNTHFDFSEQVQEQSARLIQARAAAMRTADMPVFITGDFNAGPGSAGYRVFTRRMGMREVCEDAYSGTYHGFTGEPDGRHIDWVLYGGPIDLVRKEIITRRFQGGYPSDHFPVMAEFRM